MIKAGLIMTGTVFIVFKPQRLFKIIMFQFSLVLLYALAI